MTPNTTYIKAHIDILTVIPLSFTKIEKNVLIEHCDLMSRTEGDK